MLCPTGLRAAQDSRAPWPEEMLDPELAFPASGIAWGIPPPPPLGGEDAGCLMTADHSELMNCFQWLFVRRTGKIGLIQAS